MGVDEWMGGWVVLVFLRLRRGREGSLLNIFINYVAVTTSISNYFCNFAVN